MAARIGVSTDGIKYHLNKLKSASVIRHVGPTKAGHWEVLKDGPEMAHSVQGPEIPAVEPTVAHKPARGTANPKSSRASGKGNTRRGKKQA